MIIINEIHYKIEQSKMLVTLPDFCSGKMKLKMVLSPGAGSSTVMVVSS
jgi:hypothetical protein